VAHLVANVGGGFALSNQLAREEMLQIVKPRACHAGVFCDRLPNLCAEFVRVYEAIAITGEDQSAICSAAFRDCVAHIDLVAKALDVVEPKPESFVSPRALKRSRHAERFLDPDEGDPCFGNEIRVDELDLNRDCGLVGCRADP
jgi:hypothetical protein